LCRYVDSELLHHTSAAQPHRRAALAAALPLLSKQGRVTLDHVRHGVRRPRQLTGAQAYHGMCSMLAIWGSRTAAGLYSGRNLDWENDTGINKYKLIVVHHPPETGKHAHATVGFAGAAFLHVVVVVGDSRA
jgi:hypothetical protein